MNSKALLCCLLLLPLAGCIDPTDAAGSIGTSLGDDSTTESSGTDLFYIHGNGTFTCRSSGTYCDDDTAEGLQDARNVITTLNQSEGTAIQIHAQTRYYGSDGFVVETVCSDGGRAGMLRDTTASWGTGEFLAFAGEECTHTFVLWVWQTNLEYSGHWNIVYSEISVTQGA